MSLARTVFWSIAAITVVIAVLTGCRGAVATPDGGAAAGVVGHTGLDRSADGDVSVPARSGYVGLAASVWRAGQLALWDDQRVTIGQLDGAWHHWTLPEKGFRPVTATLDRGGRLYLLDGGGRLLTFAAGEPPVQRDLPFARRATRRLRATSRGLVWLGKPEEAFAPPPVRISRDGGRSWSALRVPEAGNAGVELQVDPDGLLQLMTGSEAACGGGGQHREIGRLTTTGQRAWRWASWPLDAPYGWFTGPQGWAYALVQEGDGCRPAGATAWICAVDGRSQRPLQVPSTQRSALGRTLRDWTPGGLVAANGRALLLAINDRDSDQLLLIRGGQGRLLGPVPPGLMALALDAADRPLVLAAGRLHGWTGAEGWRPLPLPLAE